MKAMFVLFCLIGTSPLLFSQNLVTNPGFEDTVGCPSLPGQIEKCLGWSNYCNTPDYYHRCNQESLGMPENVNGHQEPEWGNAYIGLFTYYQSSGYKNTREAVGSKLLVPLQKGKRYYVSMKISLAEYSGYAASGIGMGFSTVPVTYHPQTFMVLANRSMFHVPTVVKDSTNWVKVKGSFIADSAYNYVVLGNLLTDSLTKSERLTSKQLALAYYYIDDVCVSQDSATCQRNLGIDKASVESALRVFPNPGHGIFNLCWQAGDQEGYYDFQIIDSNGKLLMSKQNVDQANSELIDLEHCSPGIYLLRIVTQNQVRTFQLVREN